MYVLYYLYFLSIRAYTRERYVFVLLVGHLRTH